ncbi:hypothetical protein AYI68_g95 [Smittium mucronatum]|uniref:Uncharacterized protein n=1 Tax=Smittium mucronatum TaxID=133383 RepID=A0A1R0H969_9FUNG|nr:hypothetical protein AYI68_g95 [Smittium mucronatum]
MKSVRIFRKDMGERRHKGIGLDDGIVLDVDAVLDDAGTADNAVLADIDVGTNRGRFNNGVFANKDVIANLARKIIKDAFEYAVGGLEQGVL